MRAKQQSKTLCFSFGLWFIGIFLLVSTPSSDTASGCSIPVPDDARFAGWWSAALTCPGGNIQFEIYITAKDKTLNGIVVNGSEEIKIEKISVKSDQLTIEFPHYDSVIRAKLREQQLVGNWSKYVGKDKPDTLPFKASPGRRKFNVDAADAISGRYDVKFESSDDLAIGIFERKEKFVSGTFLTTTGDYRFLAGSFQPSDKVLELSCFDGGHAFLFRAKLTEGKLQGDFWSRGSWHEKWTAKVNPKAKLADGFEQVRWAGVSTSKLEFPDEHGKSWNLADPKFKGKIKILQIFGSWCPNCHDATRFVSELQKSYGSRGLSVVGLAFELSSDPERNARQIASYRKRTGANYPILIAGIADKSMATKQLRILSQVKSYPTTIFLDGKDRPIAIHSGFTGPATGQTYENLKRKFRKIIERQLVEQ